MLTPPDPQHQYVVALSRLIHQGNALFKQYDRLSFIIWNRHHHDKAVQSHRDFQAWVDYAKSMRIKLISGAPPLRGVAGWSLVDSAISACVPIGGSVSAARSRGRHC